MDNNQAAPGQGDMLTESGVSLGLSLRASHMNVRVPDESERLLLSEEHVEYLCRGGKDDSFDWCLALGGASVGFAQNVISLLRDVYYSQTPSMIDTLLAVLCSILLSAAAAKYTEHRSKKGNVELLLEKIRSGRRVSVS